MAKPRSNNCWEFENSRCACAKASAARLASAILVEGSSRAMMSPVDSVAVIWSVCDDQICYSGTGMTGYFPYVNMSDTVKVCISTEFYYVPAFNQIIEYCYTCDSIFHNGNDWVSIYDSTSVGIEELTIEFLYEVLK